MYNRLLFLLTFLLSISLSSQNHKHCGFDEHRNHQLEKNPALMDVCNDIEAKTKAYVEQQRQNPTKIAEVITIPVVVHVVHTVNRPVTNISDAKVYSQLEALNRDFRRMNADTTDTYIDFKPIAADTEIEFCLAARDPNGYPTTGITRTATEKERFFVDLDDLKSDSTGGKSPWPRDQYMNMWVCNNLCSTTSGCGILGYGTPPGISTPSTDGIAIQYNFFGTLQPVNGAYDEGRTAVHEAGHWLNLFHTWGNVAENSNCNSDDSVDDTPRLDGPTFGCPSSRSNTCNEEMPDYPDMTENYMDYSNDACLNMFTIGQKLRMQATLEEVSYRSRIKESMGCVPVEQGLDDIRVVTLSQPNNVDLVCSVFEPQFTIENFGTEPLFSFTIDYSLNGDAYSFEWTGLVQPLKSGIISLPPLKVNSSLTEHELTISTSNPNGREDFNIDNNNTSITFNSIGPANQDITITQPFQFPAFPPPGWTVFNNDNNFNFRFQQSNSAGYGDTKSTYMPNFESGANFIGEADDIISPPIDFDGVYDSLYLQFFYAYTSMGEGTISDTVDVLVSIDCGENYFSLHKIFGEELITADPVDEAFVPMEGQWKAGLVNLVGYKEFRNISFKIRQIRGTGNDLYIDDINFLSGLTPIEGTALQNQISINAYPNPVRGKTIIDLNNLPINQNLQLSISNKAGQVVYQQSIKTNTSQKTIELPVENLSNGMYVVSLHSELQSIHTKLVVVH